MLLVYCEHITPRVSYIFNYLLHTLCGFEPQLTTDETAYRQHNAASLNYSNRSIKADEIHIRPNGLLFLDTIVPCEAVIKQSEKDVQLFLKANNVDAAVFDVFAASFFLITRYEEYLPYTPDTHNRFEAASSVLYKAQLLYRPLVNEWAASLKQTFSKAHTALPSRDNSFSCKISIDIDQAFAFQHRGTFKNIRALSKNLVQGNMDFLRSQLKTFSGQPDPYDTFDYLRTMQQSSGLPFIYFINTGAASKYDKNEPPSNAHFKKVLRALGTHAEIGLHPSYYSDVRPGLIQQETARLEEAIGKPILQSRQHYLKLHLPQTYRQLLQAGITEDYTMGYASHPGFRAGTCSPFPWFDLEKNVATQLQVFPITYMEGSFAEYLKLDCATALGLIKKLTHTVRLHNGCFIPLWHNHTVNDQFSWKGWKTVFEESLHYIINQER